MIIDTHTHIYPELFKIPDKLKMPADIATPLQFLNSNIRKLPKKWIPLAEKAHSFASLSTALTRSTYQDLKLSMQENNIDLSLAIAHPPFISNEFLLDLAQNDPQIKVIVNIPKMPKKELLKKLDHYLQLGAIGLKIHAAADGLSQSESHYHNLLSYANEAKLSVIIHTGCINIQPFYKDPEMGHAQKFKYWFEKYPNINFILAHMNYHWPLIAIDYCANYENAYCDISWQPTEIIQKAMDKISDKVMFGSDWPLVGNNQKVMLKRAQGAKLDSAQSKKLMFENALKVFKLNKK